MKAEFLSMADSINSLDAKNQAMQPAPVAFSKQNIKLNVSIAKAKTAPKLPELDMFRALQTPHKCTSTF